jgi:2-polyprenyl-3-methyl-5-hydroxy-6-metoxy-1,4-benzoquinol methylase
LPGKRICKFEYDDRTLWQMISNHTRHGHCPLCRSERISRVGSIPYFQPILFSTHEIELERVPELWKCQRCASAFTQNIMDADTARALYSMGQAGERWSSKVFEEEKTASVVHGMAEIFKHGGPVLDIGCNTGELLDFALGFGCATSGVEFSAASLDVLQHKGHQAYSSLEDVPGKYAVITAFDLIEHLYDVPAFLEQCIAKLAKNGRLVLLTGNIDCLSARLSGTQWWYARFPEHIVFPSKKFFSNYSGLRIEKWVSCYAGKWAKYPKYAGLKGMLNGVLRRCAYTGLPSPFPDHSLIVLKAGIEDA